jgi:hypothetical protein
MTRLVPLLFTLALLIGCARQPTIKSGADLDQLIQGKSQAPVSINGYRWTLQHETPPCEHKASKINCRKKLAFFNYAVWIVLEAGAVACVA